MSRETEAIAQRFHMEIFQHGRLEVADDIVSRDFINHFPGYPKEWRRGPEGVKKYAAALRTAFPDLYITHEETLSGGDVVMIRWTMTGTHKGAIFGIAPTGKAVKVTGIDLYRVWGPRIADLWQGWDQYGMLQQMGVVSLAGQAKA
ncbi:MAG: ester cyclase [Chloroflexi bacterium]|nr:ester cyclase [Chloroflexota bacterium]